MNIETIIIESDSVDLKIEKFLLKKYPNVNYILLQKLIRTGQIRVNKKRIKQGYTLNLNDNIRFPSGFTVNVEGNSLSNSFKPLSEKEKETISYLQKNILYQDEHILVINKPSGLPVQGGSKISLHLDKLLPFLLSSNSSLRLVHRLDKETSGVLLLAKTPRGAKYLFNQFKDRQIKKVYHCLVYGVPKQRIGVINDSLLKDHQQVKIMDNNEGKIAVTNYKILDNNEYISYLEVTPETGRMHQIRAHLGLILNTPILGDYKYGFSDKFNINLPKSKMFLHARSIYFKNINNKNLIIEADFDQMWLEQLKQLNFSSNYK
ncbi:RluA family pseudouridine synthase [Rickettsiales bacterium LUAb2]